MKLAAVLVAALLLLAARAAPGPVPPAAHPAERLREAVRRLRLSLDRELVALARAEAGDDVLAHPERLPVDQDDGFTDEVNTGEEIFRPIRPGSEVPAAHQFQDDPTPEPSPSGPASPSPFVDGPGPGPSEPPLEPTASASPIAPTVTPPASASVSPLLPPLVSISPVETPVEASETPIGIPDPPPGPSIDPDGPVVPIPVVSEAPSTTPDVPTFTPDAPSMTPGVPSETPDAPSETPGAPSETPGAPSETPGAPSETPGEPEESEIPAAPTEIPEEPTETPEPPTITPEPSASASASASPVELGSGIIGEEPSPGVEESESPGVTDVPITESPGPSAETTDDPTTGTDDGSVCFPADATVELDDGSVKKMSQVELGDHVRVGPTEFSEVFMFTHRLAGVRYAFVDIRTESGHRLSLTKGHYLYVNGAVAAAASVRVGDAVTLANNRVSTVVAVDRVTSRGLYNPQTVHGDIVVNGVRATTYTTAVDLGIAHALLAPLRAAYSTIGWTLSAFDSGADRLASLVPSGSLVV